MSAASGPLSRVPITRIEMARRLDASAPDFEQQFDALIHSKRESDADAGAQARAIIADVRERGDIALIDLSAKFDHVTLTPQTLRLSQAEIEAAAAQCSKEALAALDV